MIGEAYRKDSDEWVQWYGGECPVDADTIVNVILDGNQKDSYQAIPAKQCIWRHDPHTLCPSAFITSYRIVSEKPTQTSDKVLPVKSDGGSSSYYTFTITNKAGEYIVVETGDVLRAMVGNDFDLANIVKACRRLYEASQGRGKEGVDISYDCNKIKYFADEFKHWNAE